MIFKKRSIYLRQGDTITTIKQEIDFRVSMNAVKKDVIVFFLKRIQSSDIEVSQFFSQYSVPFSRSQYFVYKKKFARCGLDGFVDLCSEGGNRKMGLREVAFLLWFVAGGGSLSLPFLPTNLEVGVFVFRHA